MSQRSKYKTYKGSVIQGTLVSRLDPITVEGMQRITFRQLGKLTRLQSLDLTGFYSSYEKTRTLDLVNLKNLRWLSFSRGDLQEIEPEDATWIINN
ncbi:hypothetical protein BX616_002301 [Lobosporangium transversale]|nr:hypothetical protein BX616_002301 [Lobosporangium transversale]